MENIFSAELSIFIEMCMNHWIHRAKIIFFLHVSTYLCWFMGMNRTLHKRIIARFFFFFCNFMVISSLFNSYMSQIVKWKKNYEHGRLCYENTPIYFSLIWKWWKIRCGLRHTTINIFLTTSWLFHSFNRWYLLVC